MIRRLLQWLKRRWLLVLIVVAFVVLVIVRRGDVETLVHTLLQAQWQWLLVALALQLVYYVLFGLLYRVAFALAGVQFPLRELIPVLFASLFVTNLIPTGGLSGAAVFVDDAARRGQSPAQATEGVLLVWVAENVSVLPILVLGMIYLSLRYDLQVYEVVGAVIFVLFIALLTPPLLLGYRQGPEIRAFLQWVQDRLDGLARLLRRPAFLPPGWAEKNAADFARASSTIAAHPREVGNTLGIAEAHTLVNLASLYVVFLAFGDPLPFLAVAAGLSLGIAFAVISVLPFDFGLMQGIMALVYISLGVPVATAVAVVLVYGGLNTWLPLALGFLLLPQVRAFRARKR